VPLRVSRRRFGDTALKCPEVAVATVWYQPATSARRWFPPKEYSRG